MPPTAPPPAVGACDGATRSWVGVMFVVARVCGRRREVGASIGATFSAAFVSALGGAVAAAAGLGASRTTPAARSPAGAAMRFT